MAFSKITLSMALLVVCLAVIVNSDPAPEPAPEPWGRRSFRGGNRGGYSGGRRGNFGGGHRFVSSGHRGGNRGGFNRFGGGQQVYRQPVYHRGGYGGNSFENSFEFY